MVLYDKNGLFLGLGNQELSLLGYEDMEEFRNYHNDFADLFVNKPGFIFKFKNFSWIDYALHSGTPFKKVLLKLKSGKELETSLSIHEIYLQNEINGAPLCYGVEITHAGSRQDLTPAFEPLITLPKEAEENSQFEEDAPVVFESTHDNSPMIIGETLTDSTNKSDAEIEPILGMTHLLEEEAPLTQEVSFTLPLDISPKTEEAPLSIKLKFDETILEDTVPNAREDVTPMEYNSLEQIKPHDFSFDTATSSLESYPEDTYETLRNDTTLLAREENPLEANSSDETFDLSHCAEALGLDIHALAQIIEEYIETLTTTMPLISQAINTNNRNNAKVEIIKLKSVALHLHIISLYHHFEHLETSLDFDTKEELLHTLEKLQDGIEKFKDNIL